MIRTHNDDVNYNNCVSILSLTQFSFASIISPYEQVVNIKQVR